MKSVITAVAVALSLAGGAVRPGYAGFFDPPDFEAAEKLYKSGNYKEAFSAMKRLADSRPEAKRMLADMYWDGQGTGKDVEKAIKLYQEAAAANDSQAQYSMAMVYEQDILGPGQDAKAFELYKRAADQGLAQAQVKLGWLYFYGHQAMGIKQDRETTFEWFRKAAGGGDVAVQGLLANLLVEHANKYEYGTDLPRNHAKALELKSEAGRWYLSAAENGNVESMGGLVGHYTELGKPNLAAYWAAKWAESARTKEEIRRMAAGMSSMFRVGRLGKPDPAQSYKWLLVAKAHGEEGPDVPEFLEMLREKLSPAQVAQAEDEAKKWKPGQKVVVALGPDEPKGETAARPRPAARPKPAGQPLAPKPPLQAVEPSPAQAAEPSPSKAASLPPVLSPKFSLKEKPNDFALVIGIEDYKSAPKAKYAERDASAVRSYLRAMGYPERNIIHLAGADASLSGILSYLEEWLPKNIGPDSRLFVFYSGHGAPDPKSAEPYLVPWDGKLGYLKSTALPLSRFYKDLQGLKAGKVLVAMDACFSGSGARSAVMEGARPLVVARSGPDELPPDMAVLASSASGEISVIHEPAGHGLFTYEFLKSLDGPLAQGRPMTAGDAFDELAAKVSDGARRLNSEQTPQIKGDRTVPLY